MEKEPTIKFSAFENFIVKSEQKENPRNMPYLTCSVTVPDGEKQEGINNALRNEVRRLLKTSSMDGELIEMEPARDFLKTVWQRDAFLYFNGTYFPLRWIDASGQNRAEREAYVLSAMGFNDRIDVNKLIPRIVTDARERVFAVGEGGLYFPDHDNKTLFISKGIVTEEENLPKESVYETVQNIHSEIFGNDIQTIILPHPESTSHLDTHLSVIPKTKVALLEYDFYEKLALTGDLNKLKHFGYEPIKIPKANIQCPLNILYLENSQGKIAALMSPFVPTKVKDMLMNNNIESYEIDKDLAINLDIGEGGVRCVTNELHSKDPSFLRKIGFKF